MRFDLNINCDNAAFEPPDVEVARILRALADRVENTGEAAGSLRDVNGNTVGTWAFTGSRVVE